MLEYIYKGVHFGDAVAFALTTRNDGSWSGNIRTTPEKFALGTSSKLPNCPMYSPMQGTGKTGATRDAVIAALEAELELLIAEAANG